VGIDPEIPPTGGTTTGAYNTPAWTGVRFTDNGDGTVTDNLTALIWLKNADCFGTRVWADALSDCNNLVMDHADLPMVHQPETGGCRTSMSCTV